jgi:hypothetical protein
LKASRHLIAAALGVAAIVRCGGSVSQQPSRDANELLQRTAAVYATAATYRDRGTVAVDESLALVALKTFFARPRNEFHTSFDRGASTAEFVFRSESERTFGIAATTSGIVISGADDNVRAQPATIAAAAALLRPVSGTASTTILPLLARDASATSLHGATMLDDEDVHGEACYRIRGVTSSRITETLSVEKRRLVIRRVRQLLPTRDGNVERTIDFAEVAIAP